MKTNDFISDFGPNPVDVNLEKYVLSNGNYRAALWTGKYLQLTLMNIKVQGEIGLEIDGKFYTDIEDKLFNHFKRKE